MRRRPLVTRNLSAAAFAVSLVTLMLGGCPQPSPMTETPADPTGAQLFTLISQTDPFQQWAQFPGVEGIVASAPPHGPMARVFINGKVVQAMSNFTGALPDGAVIVKENLDAGGTGNASSLHVMWKVADFDAANNDWFWANFTPAGEVTGEGRIQGCANCHAGASNNDFIFLHQFAP